MKRLQLLQKALPYLVTKFTRYKTLTNWRIQRQLKNGCLPTRELESRTQDRTDWYTLSERVCINIEGSRQD